MIKKIPKPGIGTLITLAVLIACIAAYLSDPPPLRVLRHAVFDQYQRWHPRAYEPAPVRIVDIDDESLRKLGQWPWPRTQVADLIEKLQMQGAAVIGFDVVFAEPDRTSPKSMANIWNPPDELRQRLLRIPDHDEVMAKALSRGGVVLGYLERDSAPAARLPRRHFSVVNAGVSPLSYLREPPGAVSSIASLEAAAQGNGALMFFPDSDGVVRRVPLILRLGDQVMPSLAAELLRVAQEQRNYFVRASAKKEEGIQEIKIGRLIVPTTPTGEMWVHYTPRVDARYVPAWKVLSGNASPDQIKDHIVIVGTSARGLMDQRSSALGTIIPGVEAHAQAVEQMLLGKYLQRPFLATIIETLVIVAGGLLLGIIALSTSALASASATALALALIGAGAWFAFTRHGLLLDPATPGIALLLVFLAGSVMHHMASERKQRWVREAFSRYVSPNRVDFLVDNPGQLELGGRRQECSFVFTDLAGFTTLMEKMDPGDAVALLNAYLDKMIAIAFQQGGTLDRIVGDAVAIMFSAPVEQADHRQRALNCALEMHAFATGYSAELAAKGTHFGKTRIGVHSGEVIVGNFGGSNMFDYRALGDAVNTAARLESVNKHLGTTVCVSEATLSGCSGVTVRPVGRLVLKGKSEALMVYEPLATANVMSLTQDAEYEAAFNLMRDNNPRALETFEQLAQRRPADPLVDLHLARLRAGQQGDRIVMEEK
ncbi:MAG: adenylate/guanylate cyclase domain-containing protein [Burkholderiales bacterium]